MTSPRSSFAIFMLAPVLFGCATTPPNPALAMRYEKGWEKTDVDAVLARSRGEDVEVVKLGNTAWVSHHVAVVRTAEKPHYHRFHDLTVTVLRGRGILNVEERHLRMKAGDVAHIQRGTPHFFRNTEKEPAVAFVVFSPPFDGRDTVTAKEDASGDEPETKPKKKGWWPF